MTALGALANGIISLFSIVLQFDGSLRFPSDLGFTSEGMGRIAACAASVTLSPEEYEVLHWTRSPAGQRGDRGQLHNDASEWYKQETMETAHRCFLGGKLLRQKASSTATKGMASTFAATSIQTSAEAEYEALILGLDWLVVVLKSQPPLSTKHERSKLSTSSSSPASHPFALTIQGDCKTVIQQLKGRSHPRKLQEMYDQAIQRLEESILPMVASVSYQSIPRNDNKLCDGLCARLIQKYEHFLLTEVWSELGQKEIPQNLAVLNEHAIQLETTREFEADTGTQCLPDPVWILDTYFRTGTSLVPYSQRPSLYRVIADQAQRSDNGEGLVRVGVQLEREAKTVWSKACLSSSQESVVQDFLMDHEAFSTSGEIATSLIIEGLQYQIRGLQKLGKDKEASQLEKKCTRERQASSRRRRNTGPGHRKRKEDVRGEGESKADEIWRKRAIESWVLDSHNSDWTKGIPLWTLDPISFSAAEHMVIEPRVE